MTASLNLSTMGRAAWARGGTCRTAVVAACAAATWRRSGSTGNLFNAHYLIEDVDPLLPADVRFNESDAIEAFGRVWKELVVRIKGDAGKRTDRTVEELREKKYPKPLSP